MTLSLEALAQEVGKKLKKAGRILAVAESCTGGGLGYWITSVTGSSDWFDRGFITYSDEAKIALIDVKPATLEVYGAVSEQTAIEMAEGALDKSYADISIAITGVAGPAGGTIDKPVGTVWIAIAQRGTTAQAKRYSFTGSRREIRRQAIENAMGQILTLS
jgi:nicotinamide-nucleotide amidase